MNYGIEAGIVYAATKNVELELGARYMKSNVDFSGSDTYGSVVESFKVEADNFIQYYVGLNYKF